MTQYNPKVGEFSNKMAQQVHALMTSEDPNTVLHGLCLFIATSVKIMVTDEAFHTAINECCCAIMHYGGVLKEAKCE